jgi:hypothetical protein
VLLFPVLLFNERPALEDSGGRSRVWSLLRSGRGGRRSCSERCVCFGVAVGWHISAVLMACS